MLLPYFILFIAYALKGQVHVFAGRVKIVSHSSYRTSAILKYFCPLWGVKIPNLFLCTVFVNLSDDMCQCWRYIRDHGLCANQGVIKLFSC